MIERAGQGSRGYRFGFILSTLLGNATRYANLRKFSAGIDDVDCVWAPVRHYYLPDERDPVKLLPGPLHTRAVVVAQAWPVLSELKRFDAVMVHQFEVSSLLALGGARRRWPIVVNAHDNPPVIDPATYPLYPEQRDKPAWRTKLRLTNDLWAVRRAGYYLGFSEWSARILERCGLDPAHVAAQHVGLDLDLWPPRPTQPRSDDGTVRLLFVGGDFERKGGRKLLELYNRELHDRCTLDIVTKSDIGPVPSGCRVHRDLGNGDPRLIALFQQADVFVLPTTADLVPWVVLEAMASGCVVVASRIGGIPDMVSAACGMLFDPANDAELRDAVLAVVDDPARRDAMAAAARARIEQAFDAAKNVPQIFSTMKRWVDARRAQAGG